MCVCVVVYASRCVWMAVCFCFSVTVSVRCCAFVCGRFTVCVCAPALLRACMSPRCSCAQPTQPQKDALAKCRDLLMTERPHRAGQVVRQCSTVHDGNAEQRQLRARMPANELHAQCRIAYPPERCNQVRGALTCQGAGQGHWWRGGGLCAVATTKTAAKDRKRRAWRAVAKKNGDNNKK